MDEDEKLQEEKNFEVIMGRVPIMLRSRYCILKKFADAEVPSAGECPHDQVRFFFFLTLFIYLFIYFSQKFVKNKGGYFIISGSEKVIIAQERMAHNTVYVFAKTQPHKYSHTAEIKSALDTGTRPGSTIYVRILSRQGLKATEVWFLNFNFFFFSLFLLLKSEMLETW